MSLFLLHHFNGFSFAGIFFSNMYLDSSSLGSVLLEPSSTDSSQIPSRNFAFFGFGALSSAACEGPGQFSNSNATSSNSFEISPTICSLETSLSSGKSMLPRNPTLLTLASPCQLAVVSDAALGDAVPLLGLVGVDGENVGSFSLGLGTTWTPSSFP